MSEYERYTSPGNEWRILLHDSQEENDRLWCIYEGLRLKHEKLEHDYNDVVMMLCATEEQLATTQDQLLACQYGRLDEQLDCVWWENEAKAVEEQRDEARAIAGELFAFCRVYASEHTKGDWSGTVSAWLRIRPSVRRMLE